MTELSPLRRRMIEDMTLRNLSLSTQRSYVLVVAKFGRSPARLSDHRASGLSVLPGTGVGLVQGSAGSSAPPAG